MTHKQQNTALALLGGWKRKLLGWIDNCGVEHTAFFWIGEEGEVLRKQPDIRNDLNLLNRIERKLTTAQHNRFMGLLHLYTSNRDYISAEGPSRTEAILKAVSLWK